MTEASPEPSPATPPHDEVKTMAQREQQDWMIRIDAALASFKREIMAPLTRGDSRSERGTERTRAPEGAVPSE